ncbi:MAG: hypothetical protein EA403_10265, partial [Spirochaetaceae bacterium]
VVPADEPVRPRVAVVLSGGAALGLAHIGVLEVLEEVGIPVDMVVGTSMGALVGGFYAAGYSPQEIRSISGGIDWVVMFTDTVARRFFPDRERALRERFFLEAGFDRDGIHLGGGLLAGQNITAIIERLTLRIPDDIDFDELPRAFRAVAADVSTGEEVVVSSGSLSDAMRASMSIPGLFAPYRIGDRFLIDGGVVNNLPVDVARAMGADIVIAVEVAEKMAVPVERLSRSPLASIDQSTKILIETNVRPQRALADILIRPDMSGFSRMGFFDALEIADRGEAAAREQLPRLRQLAQQLHEARGTPPIAPSPSGRYFLSLSDPLVTRVIVQGGTDDDRVAALVQFAPLVGRAITPADLEGPVAAVYGIGRYDLVKTQILRSGADDDADARDKAGMDGHTLLVTLEPRVVSWGTVRVGLSYAGVIASSAYSRMVITQSFTLNNLTGRGSAWSTELGIVNVLAVSTSYFQPLGRDFFLVPYAGYLAETERMSGIGTANAVIDSQEAVFGVDLGAQLWRFGELRAGYRLSLVQSLMTELDGERAWATIPALVAVALVDSRDSRLFPRRGSAAEVEYQMALPSRSFDHTFHRLEGRGESHLSLGGRASMGAIVSAGSDFTDTGDDPSGLRPFNQFSLGDDRVFVGYRNDARRGRHRLAAASELRVFLRETPGTLRAEPVVVLDGGVAETWRDAPDHWSDLRVNWTASAGMGVRFSDALGVLLRVGMVREWQPFIALNLGAFGF